MATDFTKITPCGGCCEDCDFYKSGACKGCIAAGGERTWEGRRSVCEICTCCNEHNVSFCGICREFPCDWIVKKIDWDKDAIEKLKKLRDEYLKGHNHALR